MSSVERDGPNIDRRSRRIGDCGQSSTSTYGRCKLNANYFTPTGKKSNKVFLMALGNIAPVDDITRLPFEMCHPSDEVHMVPGIKHNLLSMNQFSEAKYITFFGEDQVNIYHATNTEVTISRGSVLRG